MHVPGGHDAYRRMIKVHTTLDLSPKEIHEIGLAEGARIDREFAELGARVLGTSDRDSTLARLRESQAALARGPSFLPRGRSWNRNTPSNRISKAARRRRR